MAVAIAASTAAARPHGADSPANRRLVAGWLFLCAGMIALMVVIGGITRLTESGLSITRWEPIGGAMPPLGAADWQRLFELYRDTPQGRLVNAGISLGEFQTIFWWEYIHRLWGRLIGAVFLLPFLVLLASGRIAPALRWKLAGLFLLGGAQGALGWFMVASGLRDQPWVSPYRLTAHLGLAVAIYLLMLWQAFGLWPARGGEQGSAAPETPRGLSRHGGLLIGLVLATLLAGGFVAGLRAGLIYNEFPWMGAGLVPSDYRNPALSWLANAFENHAAVQFHHRLLAMTTAVVGLAFAGRLAGAGRIGAALAVAGALAVQVSLGIATLIHQVPVALGAAHQAGALLLLSVVLAVLFQLRVAARR